MAALEIVQGPVRARILGAPPEALAVLSAALTFEVKGAQYMKIVQAGRWDGKTRLFNRLTGVLPAGLAWRAAEVLRERGWEPRIVEAEGFSDVVSMLGRRPFAPTLQGIILHKYQREAVIEALGATRAFLQSPTGSGKTEIGAELVRMIGRPALWLVRKKDLLAQTVRRLHERLGTPVGAIGGGFHDAPEAYSVMVGMVPTLARVARKGAEAFWDRWRVLVLDECHHSSSDTWIEVAARCEQAWWRYGLSATPLTGDPLRDARMEGATGPRILVKTIEELVEAGFLARPRIVMLRPPAESYPTYEQVRQAVLPDWRVNPLRLRKMGGRLYAESYRRGVVNNAARTRLIGTTAALHALAGEKVLVLFTDILHGHGEALLNSAAGSCAGKILLPMWILDGRDPLANRKEVLRLFRSQHGGAVLVASGIFSEGVDIPEVDVLVLAGGGKSELTTLQRVGRALRRRPDKAEVLIYDVQDGRGSWAKKDYLAQHTEERLATYRRQNFCVEWGDEDGGIDDA